MLLFTVFTPPSNVYTICPCVIDADPGDEISGNEQILPRRLSSLTAARPRRENKQKHPRPLSRGMLPLHLNGERPGMFTYL